MDQLKVSFIQSDIHWQDIDANLAMFEEKIWELNVKTDLIILPEMFSTGFTMEAKPFAEPMNSKTFRWMKQMASQTKAAIIGSYIIVEKSKFYNRLLIVFPDGSYKFYDKRHLFAPAGEDQSYHAGSSRLIVEWRGWKIMPLICYDLRFPVWSRSVDYEYDLLIYVANWPKPRINAWDTLLQARAIENLAYTAGVNRIGIDGYNVPYSGNSAIYDFKGLPIVESQVENEFSGTACLEKKDVETFRSRFNFMNESDKFTIR